MPYSTSWGNMLAGKCREKGIVLAGSVLVVDRLGKKLTLAFRGRDPELNEAPEAAAFPLKVFQRKRVAEPCQAAADYESEIIAQQFRDEAAFMPHPNHIESQGDINGSMRAILVDWLIEVHMKYRLRYETLFLAVNLIDRHMSVLQVTRRRLQLVGVVGMFIAAKYEEIDPPRVNDFVYITDNTYTRDDVMSMECTMLSALSFEIVAPTPAHFLNFMLKANRCNDERQEEFVKYTLELALIDIRMLRYTPSHLVAAAVLLSNEAFGRAHVWPENMALTCRHSEEELRGCVVEMQGLLRAAPGASLQAVRKKYLLQQHHSVARLPLLIGA